MGQQLGGALDADQGGYRPRAVSAVAGAFSWFRHFAFGPGEYLLHDLENIGPTELVFSTVEFLDGHNTPLPLD
jgi:hypothetical protein